MHQDDKGQYALVMHYATFKGLTHHSTQVFVLGINWLPIRSPSLGIPHMPLYTGRGVWVHQLPLTGVDLSD